MAQGIFAGRPSLGHLSWARKKGDKKRMCHGGDKIKEHLHNGKSGLCRQPSNELPQKNPNPPTEKSEEPLFYVCFCRLESKILIPGKQPPLHV